MIESTLEHERVEACVAEVVGGLRFAEPKGGGSVVLSYPSLFTAE